MDVDARPRIELERGPSALAQHAEAVRVVDHEPCVELGARELAEYPVFSEGGWWNVRKCQRCLASLERERGPLFGSYMPLGLEISKPGE